MRTALGTLAIFSATFATAQLTINNTGYTISQLASTLGGSGVTISNASFRGVYNVSSRYQVGAFTTAGSVQTALGFSSGVLLTSGNTSEIPLSPLTADPGAVAQVSRNYVSGTTGEIRSSNSASGQDADVQILASPNSYYNAAILEFDVVPSSVAISFRYVFGSEEYMDNGGFINYNCSTYNDRFAFLISGPGIAGGQSYSNNAKNIARLSNGSFVSINSVNNGTVGSSGGSPSASNCHSANPAWQQNVMTTEFNGIIYGENFNGNTKILTASQGGLTPGATYHIRLIITDVSDGAYDSGVFIEAGSITSTATVLPVELLDFTSDCYAGGVQLTWHTASEKENSYFTLQRAVDGVHFDDLTNIAAQPATSHDNTYQYADTRPDQGTNYYRLRQTDMKGDSRYFYLISTDFPCAANSDFEFQILGNPVGDYLQATLNLPANESMELSIYDMLGRKQMDLNTEQTQGSTTGQWPLQGLASGLYYLRVHVDQKDYLVKFMKL